MEVTELLEVAELLVAAVETDGFSGGESGLRTDGGGTTVEKEPASDADEGPPGRRMIVDVVDGGVKLMMEMGGNTSSTFASAFALFSPTSSTSSVARPARVERPSKVTSEFCAIHERLPELSLARITVPERGIVKFELASAISLGMALPRVTLLMFVDPSVATRFVVVQPEEPVMAQLEPVIPFVQIHAHTPCEITLVPPFRHGKDF